jgi:hypothetical protein
MSKKTVFLGGTCKGVDWRSEIYRSLNNKGIDVYNPLVTEVSNIDIEVENVIKHRKCNIHLYVLTSVSAYAIAEAVESTMFGKDVIVVLTPSSFNESELSSMKRVMKLLHKNGAICLYTDNIADCMRVIDNL